ncbi:MAG TPA: iron-sulfur cluster assembly scaffold protein [Terriglobales bacterium]
MKTMYSPQLLDHFQNPRNAGELDAPTVTVQLENPACGDVLRLSAKVRDGRIVEIRFRAKGCVPSMACGSAITELVAGKTVPEAKALGRENVVEAVGGLPEASAHAAYLAVDTLAALIQRADEET